MNEKLKNLIAGISALGLTFSVGANDGLTRAYQGQSDGSGQQAGKILQDTKEGQRYEYHMGLMEFISLKSEDRSKKLKEWADGNFDPVFIVEQHGWHTDASGGPFVRPDGKQVYYLSIEPKFTPPDGSKIGIWLALTKEQDSAFYKDEIPGLKPHSLIDPRREIKTSARYSGNEPLLFLKGTNPPK